MFKRTKIKGNILTVLYIIGSIWFSACTTNVESEKDDIKASTPVTITSVSYESLSDYFELNANTVFQKKNIIRSTTTGIVQTIGISMGDNVSIGEQLFIIVTKEAAALKNKTNLSDTSFRFKGELKIKATQSGIVSSIAHQQGDFVQEGDELATIAEHNSLVFLLQAPFEMSAYTKQGTSCKIVLTESKTIDGIIGSILPTMDMQAQTVTLVVKPITKELFPENLIAKIRIAKSTKKRSCTLPAAALLTNETQTVFWVMKLQNDSTAVKVIVKKGIESDGKIEILEPSFQETDKIILTGNYGLEDTAKVTVVK